MGSSSLSLTVAKIRDWTIFVNTSLDLSFLRKKMKRARTNKRTMRMGRKSRGNWPLRRIPPMSPRRRRVMKSMVLKVMMLEKHFGSGALLSYLR